MKNLATLLTVLLLLSTSSFCQSKEILQNWQDSVEKEFKEVDRTATMSNLRSGSAIYNRVRFNLLSDTYFIPAFGKPFDKLSASKIKSIGKKIRGYKQKKKYGNTGQKHPWAHRLDWYMWGVFNQDRPYLDALKEVAFLRKQRQDYTATIKNLKSGELGFNAIVLEKKQYARKYEKLTSKEIETLSTLLNTQEKIAGTKSLVAQVQVINGLRNNFQSLASVKAIQQKNRAFYQTADFNTKRIYDNAIETKTNQILTYTTTQEIKNISGLSISELNSFRTNFNKKYSSYRSKSAVIDANTRIKEAKTQKIANQFSQIQTEINASTTLTDLSRLQDLYTTDVTNNANITSLYGIIVAQKAKIKEDTKLRLEQQRANQETAIGEDMTFNSDGLYFAEFYDYIFRGHFENVEIKPQDMILYSIFEQYLRAYGKQCASYLPQNKVQIMNQVCAEERVTTYYDGTPEDRTCIRYKWVPSGLYARPDLYSAKVELENYQRKIALQTGLDYITNPNSMGNSVDLIHKAKGLKADMLKIISQNSCTSTSIKQFEENFKLYALGKPAIRLHGMSKYAKMKISGGPSGPQNFNKLIDDLVTNQSKTWGFNRYKQGSISNVLSQYKDQKGRPKRLQASYSYTGFGGVSKGSVSITFKNGLPECIYFSDFPNNCKNANSSIVSSYAQGDYRQ